MGRKLAHLKSATHAKALDDCAEALVVEFLVADVGLSMNQTAQVLSSRGLALVRNLPMVPKGFSTSSLPRILKRRLADKKKRLAEDVHGLRFAIGVDETESASGASILGVVGYWEKRRDVIGVRVLDSQKSDIVATAIAEIVATAGLEPSRCVGFASDNAKAMVAVVPKLQGRSDGEGWGPMVALGCVAHSAVLLPRAVTDALPLALDAVTRLRRLVWSRKGVTVRRVDRRAAVRKIGSSTWGPFTVSRMQWQEVRWNTCLLAMCETYHYMNEIDEYFRGEIDEDSKEMSQFLARHDVRRELCVASSMFPETWNDVIVGLQRVPVTDEAVLRLAGSAELIGSWAYNDDALREFLKDHMQGDYKEDLMLRVRSSLNGDTSRKRLARVQGTIRVLQCRRSLDTACFIGQGAQSVHETLVMVQALINNIVDLGHPNAAWSFNGELDRLEDNIANHGNNEGRDVLDGCPSLQRARDGLHVSPGTSVDIERLFSTLKWMNTPLRRTTSEEVMEAVLCLRGLGHVDED
jgi:hypothetical protein